MAGNVATTAATAMERSRAMCGLLLARRPRRKRLRRRAGSTRRRAILSKVELLFNRGRRTDQIEGGNRRVNRRAGAVDQAVTAAHHPAWRRERAARHVIKALARQDQRHFADNPLAANLVGAAVGVADPPLPFDQLKRLVAVILDPHV